MNRTLEHLTDESIRTQFRMYGLLSSDWEAGDYCVINGEKFVLRDDGCIALMEDSDGTHTN